MNDAGAIQSTAVAAEGRCVSKQITLRNGVV
jgi:hypothetical protein